MTTKIDSRTILGETGAEQLLGQGDMLYMANGGRITRVHGPFISDREVESSSGSLRARASRPISRKSPETTRTALPAEAGAFGGGVGRRTLRPGGRAGWRAKRKGSTSFIQRYLQIGYNRAARIVERMEKEGVVSQANHVGKREVLARNIDRDE